MRRLVPGLLLTAALLCGCGGQQDGSKPHKLSAAEASDAQAWIDFTRRQIAVKREMVGILKTVKGGPSMQAALDALLKLEPKAEAVIQERHRLPVLSAAANDHYRETCAEELADVNAAEQEQVRRIVHDVRDGPAFFDTLKAKLKTLRSP